ncbi:hypothetical protein C5L14_16650 [Labrys okinawensis]|uniref:Uncharacterized protein n=1 Tax=Labrys okinawensis TaxID=346911 RepID=A0A2S9QC68_9HYPH|nr:hypothetical protein [Labrys okinawensis]PRH86915.1 hypothetical protein C5L14_16650 [Labrys okinawensis]
MHVTDITYLDGDGPTLARFSVAFDTDLILHGLQLRVAEDGSLRTHPPHARRLARAYGISMPLSQKLTDLAIAALAERGVVVR